MGYNGPVREEIDARPAMTASKDWLLKALRESGSCLLSELYGLDEEDLRWRPVEGEWCLKEIAAHARDSEELALAQFEAFTSPSERRLPAWDVEVLPEERSYQDGDIEEYVDAFRSLRREVTFALWTVSDDGWSRPAEHPYQGTVTLTEIVRELARHDLEHLWQVRRIKAQLSERVGARESD